MPRTAPYGSWESPITADLAAAASVRLEQVETDGEGIYWIEERPAEGGRSVVVRQAAGGGIADVTPAGYNARTLVHEYGGGAYAVHRGAVYFSNFADQRLYRQAAGGEPEPLTPTGDVRYADAVVDERRRRLLCVCEDHGQADDQPENCLAAVPLEGGAPHKLVRGADFYASPRLSPDGSKLAWLCWNHPNMPWDGTELWVAKVGADGSLTNQTHIAGGRDESIFQPEWSPAGVLHFVSDRTGWWNLYRRTGAAAEPLCPMKAEFGAPQWVFRMSTYAFLDEGRIACALRRQGRAELALLDTRTGELDVVDTPYTEVASLRATNGNAVFIGGSPTEPAAVVTFNPATRRTRAIKRASDVEIDSGYLSAPEPIEFPTEGGQTAHALYYRPQNRDHRGPADERPPLIVRSHGGPTGAARTSLNLAIQYWTSRGIAVVDVNYGGSTGYGRAYRQRLEGNWGIVDVDDCANAARHLVKRGDADAHRLAITGGSAGGYTTLAALAFRDVFKAGASHYGVSDLAALAKDTHKFESRYLDRLVGPYPERADLYAARSPLAHADRISCPVVFFQGLEDRVVPPDQAERMVAALRERGLPVAYVPFEREQHGFRRAENIRRALEGELYFYGRVFGFEPADEIEALPIENLPDARPQGGR